MANRWEKSERLFWGAAKSLQMVTAAMKLKDACSLEEKLWPVQFSSVTQSCPTLCDPVNHSTPGLPVHHQLPEFTQTMSIESVVPSSHLILCRPLLLLPLIPLSIRVFSNESTLRMHSYLAQELAPFPQKCGTIRLKGNIKTELCNIVPFTTICLSWKCWFSRRKWLMLEFTSYTWLNAYWVEEGNGGASLRGHPMLPKST